jgi:glycosyltransferase involved in cell wall biosynthesis
MADPQGAERSLPGKARQMGVAVHDGFYFESHPNVAKNRRDIRRLSRLIAPGNYRLIHAHGSWDHILAAVALRRGPSGALLTRTDHGGREFQHPFFQRFQFGLRMTDHLVVLSDRLRASAVDRLGRPASTVSTVRGAVDVGDYRPFDPPEETRLKFGLNHEDTVIGIVARVQPHRRFDVLLEAAREVKERDPSLKILVLGRGTRKEELLDEPVRQMGLQNTVYPLGYRKDDYREVLASLDAGLMLVPGSDASCRAALEMCAMAKPLVVARRGVLPDIVADGETGIVVDDKPDNLADALIEMGEDSDRRERWGEAARRRMVEKFSLERQVERVSELYRRLLAQ